MRTCVTLSGERAADERLASKMLSAGDSVSSVAGCRRFPKITLLIGQVGLLLAANEGPGRDPGMIDRATRKVGLP